MAVLKVRLRFNPGRAGSPMDKLGEFASQAERFLRSLAADLGVDAKKGRWLAHTFTNDSVAFDGEYSEPVDDAIFAKGDQALTMISSDDPFVAHNDGVLTQKTLSEFARLGSVLDPDEHFFIGIYKSNDLDNPKEWRPVSYRKAAEIRRILEAPLVTTGAMQGVIYAWHSGASPKFFHLREMSTGALVRCEYDDALHSRVHAATKRTNTVAFVHGLIHWDQVSNGATLVKVSDIEVAEPLSDAEFNGIFGSDPNFTGDLDTDDYISWMRGDEEH